jgi:heavy metal translocating P-type ATPase
MLRRALFVLTFAGLAAGGVAALAGAPRVADVVWAGTVALVLVPTLAGAARALSRGQTGVDLIAVAAMGGALALGEYLAGAVIAAMLAGGESLESYASGRATRELSALLARAPRTANRFEDSKVVAIDVDEVLVGDRLLVTPGEVVGVDGIVLTAAAVLDESALTGESRPVERSAGGRVSSGAVNAGGPFELRAVARARDSTYAGIVRLVEQAHASKAPFVRLADRYATIFLPLTFGLAGIAWLLSGDPVRALAVLVVATPCPLLLAAPIAIISGVSRTARRGVIVKGGAALEALARGEAFVLDKTGTLTTGRPDVAAVETFGSLDPDELLRLAGSLDQTSSHAYAESIVRAAAARHLRLEFPTDVVEDPGAGVEGRVGERYVALGSRSWLARRAPLPRAAAAVRRRAMLEGASAVYVAVDGHAEGALLLDDPLRPDAPRAVRGLRTAGAKRIVMVTGDIAEIAELAAAAVGVDRVLAERRPEDKVEAVRALQAEMPTVMVGDGINDAPALAAAGVGVAMGARGATASSEAADVVLTVDRLDRLVEARRIATRARGIAVQSVVAGMGLSLVAMGFAAVGLLAPVAGAVVQEVIDLAVILNALRALGGGGIVPRPGIDVAASGRFREEHHELLGGLERVRTTADRLDTLEGSEAVDALMSVRAFLTGELLPHEQAEEAAVYPLLASALDGEDPTPALALAHREIARLIHQIDRLCDEIAGAIEGLTPEDRREARRLLYGLHAILRLHFSSEEEAYLALEDRHGGDRATRRGRRVREVAR